MKYADRLRIYLMDNPAIFTASDLIAALPAPLSTIKSAIKALADDGEIELFECKLGQNAYKYQPTDKLGTMAQKADRRTLPRRTPVVATARVVRFVEDPQDANPEHGVYYHRPQPAQAVMQPKSGPGMIW